MEKFKNIVLFVLSIVIFEVFVIFAISHCDTDYKTEYKQEISHIDTDPQTPGVYRIWDKDDRSKYIGESVNMKKRIQDHKRDGKLVEGDKVDYIEMLGSTSDERRQREKEEIEKNKPYMNKSKGGEGRKIE